MSKLSTVISGIQRTTFSVEKYCNIKKYITIKEKFGFIDEYKKQMELHSEDYEGFEELISFVFFNLMVVKKYTDIELEMTYDEFDMLMEFGLFKKIIDVIGDDYKLLLEFTKMVNT